ncbi:MAG TPA: DUF3999 family protein [Rhodocyclaceae bacterium]|nr:DUF3999 family protein [Rhodocyclaceae bacterium]
MQKNHPIATLALLFSFAQPAAPALAAAPPKTDTPADYAYALPLQLSGKQGVVGLAVPQVVYLKARTAGLDDLRVFDARGVAQPYALQRPPGEVVAQRGSLPASIFPLRGDARPAAGNAAIDLDIQTRTDGSVRSVRARAGQVPSQETTLRSLILDFGAAASADAKNPPLIEALHFSPPADKASYSVEVWLEASKDLKRWEAIGAAELNWLNNEHDQTLTNDRLELNPQTFRYARLSWRRGEPALFSAIRAETVDRQISAPVRETLWVQPLAGKLPGDLVYPAGIALPVEQISLKLSEPNIVYPMALGGYVERPSRQVGKAVEWVFRPKVQTTFYQITQDGQTRRSGPLNIDVGHQQEWVIHPFNGAATARPELGLSWQAATLVFLAGGTPPYTMNFGRSDARPASQPLAQVAPGFTVAELRQLEAVQVGELRSSDAEAAGKSAAAEASAAARQRSAILWGVLLLGVAVLGGMAWRLVRQVNADSGKPLA